MDVLGLIVARAGSKGIPNKNLLNLGGRPVLAYTIEDARKSKTITRIVVSTDSADIAHAAAQRGVEVIDRPPELATDEARLDYVVRHALDLLKRREGYVPDVIALLAGNVPLREEGIIDRCVEHLLRTGADSVRSFSATGKYHPQWMNRIEGDRVSEYERLVSYRRQDLEPLYIHDGACIAVRFQTVADSIHHLKDNFCLLGNDRRGIISNDGATVEIDTARDVYAAEAALKHRKETDRHDDHA